MGKAIFEQKPFNLLGHELKNQFIPNELRRNIYMTDKSIICKDCHHEFIFNESEQAFYKEKGFENEPQRCPDYGTLTRKIAHSVQAQQKSL